MLHAATFCLLFALCSSAHVFIPKCCGHNEHLNNSLKCVLTPSATENWDWILNSLVDFKENKTFLESNVVIQENSSLSCSIDTRSFLLQTTGDFELVLTEEGNLQLKVLVYSKRDEDQWALYGEDSFCLDAATRGAFFCPCTRVPCVSKCCMESYTFNKTSAKCDDTGEDDSGIWRPDFEESAADEGYYIIENRRPKCNSKRAVLVPTSNVIQFNVSSDGSAKIPGYENPIGPREYCGDTTVFLVCPQRDKEIINKFLVYGILLLIAGSLLLAAVLVNCWLLPPIVSRKLHNRFLTAHNAALACAYFSTGLGQIIQNMTGVICVSAAFIIQFAFLAAFFWLNVMCIDIAWAFSGLRPPQGSAVERDQKKLLYYSAYAWGTTGIISIITAVVEFIPGLLAPDSGLKPNFGHRSCWFEKPAATLAYFYGPMAFLLLGNLVLFMYTAAKIISVRRDTAILNSAGNTAGSAVQKDRQRLALYIKLFCLMGLTWVTEIISWAVGGAQYYWYITDVVNMLRAVFIFAIFCCKRSVLHLLRVRLASTFPCMRKLARGKSTISFSGPTSSVRLTTSYKKSVRRLSIET